MTAREVWIDGARRRLEPAALIGQGGEAEVYDLADGRVLKWWKPADHPDFDGQPAAQAAAAHRLVERPAKLRALPGNLPAAVVAPCGVALDRKRAVVGYLMPRVAGAPLHAYGEPRWRREHAVTADVVPALLALHDAIAALHRAGVVVGDCNDLNVLVDGRAVHLIDVDSYQFGTYPCAMFSERFVDPRLCPGPQLVPAAPHDRDSDWFAFAAMALRTLLGVGPWGGVAKACPASARALRRLSLFAAGVTYPRTARPATTLPDALVAVFRDWFERDRRGVFPRAELERLHLAACPQCGEEHARALCPGCRTRSLAPPAQVVGRLRWHAVAPGDVELATREVGTAPARVWLGGGALWRAGRLGPERIGSVLAGQTRAWVGVQLGVGFYRAGGYAVGFVFHPERGPLDERIALPKIRGQLVDAHATLGERTAWLWLTTVDTGRLVTTAIVITGTAVVVDDVTDAPWLAGLAGACAAGPHLFVPTDDGIARIEIQQDDLVQTRSFPETAALISAGDRLALAAGAIDAVRARDAIRLSLT